MTCRRGTERRDGGHRDAGSRRRNWLAGHHRDLRRYLRVQRARDEEVLWVRGGQNRLASTA
jgi:hypothetical protein